ncbi:MAG: hypothetical protein ACOYMK_10845 [Hyphomonadaceae bacterium]
MRSFILLVAIIATAACGGPAPASPVSALDGGSTEAAPAPASEVTDANELTIEDISARLLGQWQAADDDKAQLDISRDGKWTSVYEGEPLFVADWMLFPGDKPPAGAVGPFTPASRYLAVKEADGVFYYELGHVTADAFDMFYTARGNNLGYVRVK